MKNPKKKEHSKKRAKHKFESHKRDFDILYGVNSVYEALLAGRRKFFEIFISKDPESKNISKIVSLATEKGVKVSAVSSGKVAALSESDYNQGVCMKAGEYPVMAIENYLKLKDPFLLLVENVVDPGNLGALIRTAHCAGVDGIITLKDRAASHTPTVSRASAGALEHVNFSRVTNMVNCIKELKDSGIWVTGLDAKAEISVFEANLKGPLAIVVGGEDKGVRPLVQKNCDFLVSIPQKGSFNSLNASVAGAVVLYEAVRQRTGL